MTGLIKDDGEIVCYYVLISSGQPNGDFIEGDPVLKVLLAVILLELL